MPALLFTASVCAAQVNIDIATPQPYSTVSSPMNIQATASSSHPITGWQVYVDGANLATGSANSKLNTSFTAPQGAHQVTVRAWDSTGAYGSQVMNVTVQGTASASVPGIPTPPTNATVFNNIDQITAWGACGTAACAGGTGKSAYWQALNQGSPSMDGNSMQIYNAGVWGNALWWTHLGSHDSATNMLWDFYVYFDGSAASNAQALEYDMFQFVNGYNYMIGTECVYADGVWDTWSEASGKWQHTTIPCSRFSAGSWHHIQLYATLNHTNHTYQYVTLAVDGKSYTMNQTQSAKNLGWSSNIGVQYQIDVNASGAGVHEWTDKSKLTIW